MKGTIRTLVGLLILFGVAGGIDNAADGELIVLGLIGAIGMALAFSGVNAMNRV